MKVKKIVFSMVIALMLLAIMFSQSVFATPLSTPRVFVELVLDNNPTNLEGDYWFNGNQTSNRIRLFKLGEQVGNSVTRQYNFYCGGYGTGFTQTARTKETGETDYTDTYSDKYNMSTEKNTIQTTLHLYSGDAYDEILALADLFYLGTSTDDFEQYGANILTNAYADNEMFSGNGITYLTEKNSGRLITQEQVRTVQQAALWYFTNGVDVGKDTTIDTNLSSNDFLYYQTTQNGELRSLAASTSTAEKSQNTQALVLYQYLIKTAIANKANKNQDTEVYLYTNPSDLEHTQPIIEIIPIDKEFDLALRKFITKINGTAITELGYESREPKISNDNSANRLSVAGKPNEYTAKKEHTKTPLSVEKGNKITYTIRIYNEGEIDGYATEVTDYLPDGLELAENSTINTTYGWTSTDGKTIKTDYLKDTLIKAANREFNKLNNTDYYKDLQIECTVKETATNKNMKNIAEITSSKDKNGNTTDVDSQTKNVTTNPDNYNSSYSTTGRGEQDDDDYEELRLKLFDLSLRKYISKVESNGTVTTYEGTGARRADVDVTPLTQNQTTANYKHKKDPVVVEKGDFVTYKLVIYNEGEIAGRATTVIDQLPEGVEFVEVVSGNFTGTATNNILTLTRKTDLASSMDLNAFVIDGNETTLESEIIEIKCKVTANPDPTNAKVYTNIAWIANHTSGTGTNEHHYDDRDSNKNGNNTPTIPANLVTTMPDVGYTNNDDHDLTDKTHYFKGQEDDDDFEKIELLPRYFDLALRKFITKITNSEGSNRYTQAEYKLREPVIGTKLTEGVKAGEITYRKEHSKVPMGVAKGDIVTYTIRVYNEGKIAGSATEITDILPEGLKLAENSNINTTNGWTSTDGKTIKTTKLARTVLQPCDGDYRKLNQEGYFADVEIQCEVIGNSKKLKNVAEITKDSDDDNDSTPGNLDKTGDNYGKDGETSNGRGYEDDDDFEDLKLFEFDLALRKYITKVEDKDGKTVTTLDNLNRTPNIDTSSLENGTTAIYKHRKDPVVVTPGSYVYYKLEVYNEGNLDGYAKTITDHIPAGLEFVEVMDEEEDLMIYGPDSPIGRPVAMARGRYYDMKSYDKQTNTLVLEASLEGYNRIPAYTGNGNKLSSAYVTIKCKVTADDETGSDKIYTNIAWISEDYNSLGIQDRDSKPSEYPTENKLVTDINDNGYIGNQSNKNKKLDNADEYFEGLQDDDDFEKVVIYKGPEVHKGVKDVKNQDSGYDEDVTTPHEWVIQSTLPGNIKNYKKYIIVDDIDYRLVYGKIKSVNIIDNDGVQVAELKADKDYKVNYTANNSTVESKKYSGTLTLTFIEPNNEELKTVKNYPGNKIEVRFTTTFAKDSNGKLLAEIIGKDIPNKAKLQYSNSSESEGEKETEEPEVHTGAVTLYKYTTKNNEKVGLKDAEFEIYRTEADAKAKKNAVKSAKSDENGLVEFIGLEYGEDAMDDKANFNNGLYTYDSATKSTDYWVVETKAPKGYKTIKDPIKVAINNDSYQTNISVLVKEEESKDVASRLVENKPLEFDLSLRKFITAVNDKEIEESREPVVDVTKLKKGKSTTAEYTHPKDPIDVVNSDIVSYSLRIYNEGQIDGYASIITDDIPDGLEFLPDNEVNKEYRWVMYEEVTDETKVPEGTEIIECKVKGDEKVRKFIETKKASKASIIRTDYLSMEQGKERMSDKDTENPNLIKAFDGEKLDYKDVKLAFKVIEPNGSKRVLINYAQISDDTDENGDKVEDRDSKTNEWNEGEDDQDIEKVRVPLFDLALRKWVTQAIVIENGKESVTNTGHDAWDDPEEVVKVELHRKKLTNVTVKFRYSIRIYNQGEIAGYAKEITDYIPQGLKFVAEDNKGWTDEGNNVISTRLLENTLLQPGESADVEVLLTWINGTDNLGLKVNTAEISEDYNEKHVPDVDSVPDNKKPGEDDIDDAPVMLSVSTGSEVTYFALGLGILVVIAGGVFLIKKYVL